MKSTRRFCFVASTPSAIARCVLPVPIGPAKIRFSGAVTHSPRASVWIWVALTPSAAAKSKVSSVFTSGKRASRSRWRITDSCRDACSAREDLVQIVLVRPVRVAGLTGQAFKRAGDARAASAPASGRRRDRGRGWGRSCGTAQEPAVVVGGTAAHDVDVAQRGRHRVERDAGRAPIAPA